MSVFEILLQGNNFLRLLSGLFVTLQIALFSTFFAIIFGIPFGLILRSKFSLIRQSAKTALEFFRIIPQLVLLFILYYELSTTLSAEVSAVIVFSIWGAVEMGDLVRGAIENIDSGKIEAGKSVGMNEFELNLFVVLPLTIRQLIPVTINLITRIVKTTAIVPLIGIVEVLKVGQQIIDYNRQTFPTASVAVYGIIFIIYFVICFSLSQLANKIQKRIML